MFTYVTLGTNDMPRAMAFYDAVLAPLGLQRCATPGEAVEPDWAGWGRYEDQGKHELALWVCSPFNGQAASVGNGTMVAFKASSWAAVQLFHQAACALEAAVKVSQACGLNTTRIFTPHMCVTPMATNWPQFVEGVGIYQCLQLELTRVA